MNLHHPPQPLNHPAALAACQAVARSLLVNPQKLHSSLSNKRHNANRNPASHVPNRGANNRSAISNSATASPNRIRRTAMDKTSSVKAGANAAATNASAACRNKEAKVAKVSTAIKITRTASVTKVETNRHPLTKWRTAGRSSSAARRSRPMGC